MFLWFYIRSSEIEMVELVSLASIWPNGTIFHQPGFSCNKGISLTKPPFGGPGRVRSRANLTRSIYNLQVTVRLVMILHTDFHLDIIGFLVF